VLLGAFLLERLACLLGHVLSRRFVGHGAPWLGAPADSQVRRYASSVSMTHEIGERRLAIRDTAAPVSAPAHQRASHSSLASRALGTMPRSGRSIDSEVKRSSPPKRSSIRHERSCFLDRPPSRLPNGVPDPACYSTGPVRPLPSPMGSCRVEANRVL
jgi:hypothetical protein